MESVTRRTLVQAGLCGGTLAPILGAVWGTARTEPRPRATDVSAGPLRVRPAGDRLGSGHPDETTFVAAPEFFATHGVEPGRQVRVRRSDAHYAAYTVTEHDALDGAGASTLWMSAAGRRRLAGPRTFRVAVDGVVPGRLDTLDAARRRSEFVEDLVDSGGNRLAVVAPHGGWIERHTDRQAVRVATRLDGTTAWCGRGYRQGGGAYDRWHVTSTALDPRSYPELASIAGRGFEHAVSFHGYDGDAVLVGGAAPSAVKDAVRAAIDRAVPAPVRVVERGPYDGNSPENLVNWLTRSGRNGVQIEQGYDVREGHWEAVADAVADAYASKM